MYGERGSASRRLVLVIATMVMGLVLLATQSWAAPVTPEGAIKLINAWSIGLSLFWGVIHKHVPLLKNWANDAIGWVNVLICFLGTIVQASGATGAAVGMVLGIGTAHATPVGALTVVPDVAGMLIAAATNSAIAKIAYDVWGKVILCRWLKLPVPRPAGA